MTQIQVSGICAIVFLLVFGIIIIHKVSKYYDSLIKIMKRNT